MTDFLNDAKIIVGIYNTFKEGSALIAGGCVRDIVLGREVKDIDILVAWDSNTDYREAEILADRLGYTVQDCSDGYGDNADEQLRCVYKLSKSGHKPIDIIFLNCSVMELVKNFPCNASMVWLEGDVIEWSAEFDDFNHTRVLDFYSTCTDEYKERMLTYFPQDNELC